MDKSNLLHLSKLARIDLTPKEISAFQKQLQDILDHINRLNKVNTDHVSPTFQTTSTKHNFYKRIKSTLSSTKAISTSQKNYQNFIVVPPSIDK